MTPLPPLSTVTVTAGECLLTLSGDGLAHWTRVLANPAPTTQHRMAVSPLNGALWAPERYAIDYVRLTPDGRLFNGDKGDLGGGNYIMYAHLKTASTKVKAGDRLTTGQGIGAVGNTGNTDAPHLHFQLMSAPDPLRANGLPFLFDKFRLNSRLSPDSIELVDSGGPAVLQQGVTAADKTLQMPLYLDAMNYPGR